MILCAECENNPRRYADPRSPPLDEGLCLCEDCIKPAMVEALEDRAGALEDQITLALPAIGRKQVYDTLINLNALLTQEGLK